MKVTVLGCGGSAGVPAIGGADGRGDWGRCDPDEPRNRRSRASIVLENAQNQRLLVDTSPDLRTQLLACGIPRVDAIFYTHPHADHIAGIDEVRILNRICGHPLEAFGDRRTLAELRARFGYAFQPWGGNGFYKPVLTPVAVEAGETVRAAGMEVRVFEQDHGFTHSLGLRCGGFAYSTDVVGLDEAALTALEGIEVWMVDCFQPKRHPSHASLDRVLEWVARLKPARTVLTHMGGEMDYRTLVAALPDGVEPAFDGMEIFF